MTTWSTRHQARHSLTRRTDDLPADDSDERRQFSNQVILKAKNLDAGVRKAVKLGEEIHQLETETTGLAPIAYPELATKKAADTVQEDPDMVDDDFSDEEVPSDAEQSTPENPAAAEPPTEEPSNP